jgi:Signal transduction histidine kinase
MIVMALNRSAVAAVVQAIDGTCLYVANLPDCWTVPPHAEDPRDRDIFGEDLGGRIAAAKEEVIASGQRQVFEEVVPGERYFEFTVETVPVNQVRYMLTTIAELTAERRREQMLKALLREVSHRSKNLLAIILSIATQTARNSPSLPSFLSYFRGRIFSLSQSQDLITDKSWRGASLRELARVQAGKYLENESDMLAFEGLDPILDPNQSLHIGLAFHELFVDAISHARHDVGLPQIVIHCEEMPYEDSPGLQLIWTQVNPVSESDEEDSEADTGDELRSTVLNRVTPLAIGGRAEMTLNGEVLVYKLFFPHREFVA